MLYSRLKIIQARAAQANKTALEAEKQRDELHTQIEQIEEQVQPKRAHTDDDADDAHDLLAEFDNCDLRDHRRKGTRVENRRHVQVGSLDNQQKPLTGKDGFLHHTRLGLVGWISYVRVLSRPLGQKTSSQSHHHQGFGIARKGYQILL